VQRLQPLDRDHPLRNLRQERCLISASGTDLEHRAEVPEPSRIRAAEQQLDHAADHRRLGDGLAVADRQAGVFVGLGGERGVDEMVPRHARERLPARAARRCRPREAFGHAPRTPAESRPSPRAARAAAHRHGPRRRRAAA
jgi:hypothetical protein